MTIPFRDFTCVNKIKMIAIWSFLLLSLKNEMIRITLWFNKMWRVMCLWRSQFLLDPNSLPIDRSRTRKIDILFYLKSCAKLKHKTSCRPNVFYGGIFFSSDFFYSLKSASEWCNYFQEKENNWVEREIIIGAEKGFKKVDILCVGIYFCWSLLRELKTTKHLYVTLNLNCVLTSFNIVFLAMKKSLKWIGNFRGNPSIRMCGSVQ